MKNLEAYTGSTKSFNNASLRYVHGVTLTSVMFQLATSQEILVNCEALSAKLKFSVSNILVH